MDRIAWKEQIKLTATRGPVLLVGIGLPGSGKTTILKPLAVELDAVYVNRDDIREELTGDASNHSMEREVTATANRRVAQGLKQGNHVIVDATHNSQRSRKEIIRFARRYGSSMIIGLYVNVDIDISLLQNSKRNRVVPEEVVQQMHTRLRESQPRIEEGFDILLTTNPAP